MIFEIFVLIISIAAFLMWYGYYSKIRAFGVVGLAIVFLLGSWIILYNYTGQNSYGLQYQSGNTVTYNGSMTIVTPVYLTYNDSTAIWVGVLLSFISSVGMWLVAAYQE